jgi:Zn-dependent M28 family amino/carboxypeptidase
VIGILPGTDADLRDEWVILTAHYDHVGVFPVPPGEDGIYNGADDNASGTAAVLEVARRLGTGGPMKRSVMVAFLAGEDMGLLGSAYYAAHPIAPLDRTVVDINVDMVGRSQGTAQALAPGCDELFEVAVELGAAAGLAIIPDQQPTWRLSYFLDSYHFARNNVPFISVFTALHEDYHQPSDEAEKIRFNELEKVVEMVGDLAAHYGGGAERPEYQRPEWFLTPAS